MLLLTVIFTDIFKSKNAIYVFVVILILFSGFRYDAGIDYFSYENMINGFYSLDYIEPLSRVFLLVARSYEAPFIFFLLTSIVYVCSIFIGAFRFKSYSMLFVFLFTTFTTSYLTSFGFVRQYVAIGLIFLGFSYLYENKKKLFLFFVTLAGMFHLSGVIFILFLFFNKLFKKKYSIYVFTVLMILSFFSTKIFMFLVSKLGLFAYYFERTLAEDQVSGKKIFYSLILVFFFVSLIQRAFVKNNKNNILTYAQNMAFVGLFIYGTFFQFGEKVVRISYFFIPFYFVWFYQLYNELRGVNIKMILLVFLFTVCTFYYFSTLYFAQSSYRGDYLNNYELFFLR
nr:EpsG family protein [Tenacibaculum piscium]